MTEIAVVTGASRGIGREVCRQLARQGMTVILTARDRRAGQQAAAELAAEAGDVSFHPLDVTDQGDVDGLVDILWQRFGVLDVLVNNAAAPIDWSESPSEADLKTSSSIMDTNVFGTWRVTSGLLPLLRVARVARVVNVSRAGGTLIGPDGLHATGGRPAGYGVAKAALHALTCAFAGDLDGTGVMVNAVCPGLAVPGLRELGGRPVQQSAADVVWAATLPEHGPRGALLRDRRPQHW